MIIVQTLHYFPFIFLNASASLANVDPSLEEMAQNMGAHGLRLFRRVTLPLMMPGYVAGVLLVFIRVIDDLGTPLMLNYTKMLAPQAYLRVTTIGVEDKAGYVICVIMVVLSLLSLWLAMKFLSLSEYAMVQRGGTGTPISKKIRGWKLAFVLVFSFFILGISLLPHLGIFVLSFAKVWSFSILPKSYTLNHYVEIFFRTPHFVKNTLLYCLLAAGIDVILGSVIAFLLIRGRVWGKGLLDAISTMPLAIPGVVLGDGLSEGISWNQSSFFSSAFDLPLDHLSHRLFGEKASLYLEVLLCLDAADSHLLGRGRLEFRSEPKENIL